MVHLYAALKITGILKENDEVLRLKNEKEEGPGGFQILTVCEVKNRYDLKNTIVTAIRPHFCCGDYDGWLFIIKSHP